MELLLTILGLWFLYYVIKGMRSTGSSSAQSPHRPVRQTETAPAPHRELTFDIERQAANEHRRVWIDYEDNYGDETERKIEIYNAQDDQYVFAWCCLRKGPRTFRRDRIKRWKILDEQFGFDPLLERWFKEEYPHGDSAIPWPRFREMNGGGYEAKSPESMTYWELQELARNQMAIITSSDIASYTQVIKLFEISIEKDPTSFTKSQTHRTLGELYQQCGMPPKAIEHFEMALRLNPGIGIRKALAKLQAAYGKGMGESQNK